MCPDDGIVLTNPDDPTPKVDILEGLVEKAAVDKSLPFRKEIVIALAQLKGQDPCKFEITRCRLKDVGVAVHRLDKLISTVSDPIVELTDRELLLKLIGKPEVFYEPGGDTAYIDSYIAGVRQTFEIRKKKFRKLLAKHFF
jgi:hypothetical protein